MADLVNLMTSSAECVHDGGAWGGIRLAIFEFVEVKENIDCAEDNDLAMGCREVTLIYRGVW